MVRASTHTYEGLILARALDRVVEGHPDPILEAYRDKKPIAEDAEEAEDRREMIFFILRDPLLPPRPP
jgi:hypothetical protein